MDQCKMKCLPCTMGASQACESYVACTTIVLLFNELLDIGWQLLSQDKTNTHYKADWCLQLQQTIYHHVWNLFLANQLGSIDWHLCAMVNCECERKGSFRRIMENLHSFSNRKKLLEAEGGSFKYMDTVWLTVTNGGLISVLDDNCFE